jgi:hypothetical protein
MTTASVRRFCEVEIVLRAEDPQTLHAAAAVIERFAGRT